MIPCPPAHTWVVFLMCTQQQEEKVPSKLRTKKQKGTGRSQETVASSSHLVTKHPWAGQCGAMLWMQSMACTAQACLEGSGHWITVLRALRHFPKAMRGVNQTSSSRKCQGHKVASLPCAVQVLSAWSTVVCHMYWCLGIKDIHAILLNSVIHSLLPVFNNCVCVKLHLYVTRIKSSFLITKNTWISLRSLRCWKPFMCKMKDMATDVEISTPFNSIIINLYLSWKHKPYSRKL